MTDAWPDTLDLVRSDIREHGWQPTTITRVLAVLRRDPNEARRVVEGALKGDREVSSFLRPALAFAAESDFPHLANVALNVLRLFPKHENAEEVVAALALQRPTVWHSHLDELFVLCPNTNSEAEGWPWRESGDAHFAVLAPFARGEKGTPLQRNLARRRLLETRTPRAMRLVLDSNGPGTWYLSPDEVGFGQRGDEFVQLDADEVRHLIFPPGFLAEDYWGRAHPTWTLPTEPGQHAFGGLVEARICGVCGADLHRLLALDPVPPELGVNLPSVTFAACVSCLGWDGGTLNYRHDDAGVPESLDYAGEFFVPDFPSPPLRAGVIRLARTPPRWRWQNWGHANGNENLHRLGGFPAWVQSADHPQCPSCAQTMRFVLQFDSGLPLENGDECLWGSGGVAYVFWCDPCRVSSASWQCT